MAELNALAELIISEPWQSTTLDQDVAKLNALAKLPPHSSILRGIVTHSTKTSPKFSHPRCANYQLLGHHELSGFTPLTDDGATNYLVA